ncbi:MAG TPA: hypothetical protein VFJ16_25620 [Longimicrobium sp.]|nr:hypothetical protein [Longimicrobium sp.]
MTLETILASPVLGLLALLGGAALVYRLGRTVLRLGIAAAEKTAIDGMVEVSIRHGDLTTMAERKAHVAAVRRARWRAGLLTLLWASLLVIPAVLDVTRPVYALAALAWLLPRRPLRFTPAPSTRE